MEVLDTSASHDPIVCCILWLSMAAALIVSVTCGLYALQQPAHAVLHVAYVHFSSHCFPSMMLPCS